MTVQQQYQPNNYTASGAQAVFDYTFQVLDEADLAVYLDGSRLSSGYTVGGVGNVGGGTVTLNTAPDSGVVVTLMREMAYQQQTSYPVQGPFPSKSHELALDKMALRDQQLNEVVQRSFRLPVGLAPTQFSPLLPREIVGSADKLLGTNKEGTGFVMLPEVVSFTEWLERSEKAADDSLAFKNETQGYRNEALQYRNSSQAAEANTLTYRNSTQGFRDESEDFKNSARDSASLLSDVLDDALASGLNLPLDMGFTDQPVPPANMIDLGEA